MGGHDQAAEAQLAFLQRHTVDHSGTRHAPTPWSEHGLLRQELRRWLAKARRAGLDEESIEALFMTTFPTATEEDIA